MYLIWMAAIFILFQRSSRNQKYLSLLELAAWPHLSKVKIQNIKASIDLLIGTNSQKVFEPWEVLKSCGNGPYGVKTVLGWIVNGSLNGGGAAFEHSEKVFFMETWEMLTTQYNHNVKGEIKDRYQKKISNFW